MQILPRVFTIFTPIQNSWIWIFEKTEASEFPHHRSLSSLELKNFCNTSVPKCNISADPSAEIRTLWKVYSKLGETRHHGTRRTSVVSNLSGGTKSTVYYLYSSNKERPRCWEFRSSPNFSRRFVLMKKKEIFIPRS